MLSTSKDSYNTLESFNRFTSGLNHFNLTDYNVLPTIEINLLNDKHSFKKMHQSNENFNILNKTDIENNEWFENEFHISKVNVSNLM